MFFLQRDLRSSPAAPLPPSSLITPAIATHHSYFMASSLLPPVQLEILLSGCPDQSGQRAAQADTPPPPSPSTLLPLCTQPRDLICLVISGLTCSAQLHSKVKLDEGTGASPCKKRFTLTAAGVGSGLHSSAGGRGWREGGWRHGEKVHTQIHLSM